MRGARVDLSGKHSTKLEATHSRADVMEFLGCGPTKLHELMQQGRRFRGVHPTKGGLFPIFRVSHKCIRIPQSAIDRHLAHMDRLVNDDLFAARMKAKEATL